MELRAGTSVPERRAYMRHKYPDARQSAMAWLYLRRAVSGLAKYLRFALKLPGLHAAHRTAK